MLISPAPSRSGLDTKNRDHILSITFLGNAKWAVEESTMRNKTISACWKITPIMLALIGTANANDHLRFQVYLDEKPIGEHSFRISDTGDLTRVSSSAAFDVDFLFVNVYRYRHDSREVFRDGCLQEIRATTNDNGTRYRVEGEATGKQFRIEREDGMEQTEGCLKTFAYWDPGFLDQKRLLNAQTGKLEPVSVRPRGSDRVQVGGRAVPATRYALSADDLSIDLWYNDELGWVGLASDTGKAGRLVYRRM
jgi:hypothetical protein